MGRDVDEFDNLMRTNKASREWAYTTAKAKGLNVGKDQAEFDSLVAPQAASSKNEGITVPLAPQEIGGWEMKTSTWRKEDKNPAGGKEAEEPARMLTPEEMSDFLQGERERIAAGTEDVIERSKRIADRNTPQGRQAERNAEWAAHVAGTPTRVLGVPKAAVKDESPTGDAPVQEQEQVKASGQSPVPHGVVYEDGKPRTEWVLPDGSLTTSRMDAEHAEYAARQARDEQRLADRMRAMGLDPDKPEDVQTEYLLKEKRRIETEMGKRGKELDVESAGFSWRDMPRGGGALVHTYNSATVNGRLADPAYKALTAQLHQVNEGLAVLDASKRNKAADRWIDDSSNWAARKAKQLAAFGIGSWRGLAHAVGKVSTWDMGMTDMANNAMLYQTATDADRQGIDNISQEERDLLNLTANTNAIQAKYGKDLGYGYAAGNITGESLPFMMEFILNPASRLGQTAVNQMMRVAVERYGKAAVKAAAKKYLAAKIGTRVVGDIAGAAVMAGTTGQGRVTADMLNRMTGDVQFREDGNGRIVYDGREGAEGSMATALLKAFGAQTIENHSEMLGAYFAPILGKAAKLGRKGMEKIGLGKVNRLIDDLGATNAARMLDDFKKRTRWNGTVEEYAEEVAGGIENALLVGDNTLDTEEGRGVFNREENIKTFLGVGLMGGFLAGAKMVSYRGPKRRALDEMAEAGKAIDSALEGNYPLMEQWGKWRNTFLIGTDEEKESALREVMNNEELPWAFRKGVLGFVKAAQKYEGLSRAQESKVENGEQEPAARMYDASYDTGYETTDPEGMEAVRSRMEAERKRLAEILGLDNPSEVDGRIGDPLGFVEEQLKLGDEERVQAAVDYANARSAYEGMVQRTRDDIDGRIEQSNRIVDERTNHDTGMIQGIIMKIQDENHNDRRGYVLSGNLVMLPDGTGIDHDKSDGSIIVRYADTGAMEVVSPEAILSMEQPVDPKTEKMTAAEAIRQQYGQQEADRIDGRVAQASPSLSADKQTSRSEQPEYALNYGVTLRNDDGSLTEGIVVDANYDDGYMLVQIDTPQGERVIPYSREELDNKVQEVRNEDGHALWKTGEASGNSSTQNGNIELQNIPVSSETFQAAGTSGASALERIPKDEQGQPLYEQADPETAWDAIVEQTGGDEEIVGEVVADLVEEQDKALKAAEKELKKVQEGKPQQKKGDAPLTMDERIAAKKVAKEQLSQARANVDVAKKRLAIWRNIANTPIRRKQAALAAQSKAAEEAAQLRRAEEEKLRAEREEAERIRREALNGVPDFIEDTPQDARARGYRRVNGNKVDRQQAIPARQGNEVQVKFDDSNIPTGHVALIDASQLQPSHINGLRNPLHFIDEAQPKERNDEASVMSARKIAANIRPEEITSSVTAYTGAPTVNSRGEVIQGNNRSAALREMWAAHLEQATRYKQYLTEHAADFGLTPEDVEAMQQPVLVNVLDVTDDEAITLGQFVAQDTESGGTERIKPKNIVQKMGNDMRSFAGQLLASPDEEMSFAELVDRNGSGVLKWMQQKGYITPTQYKSAFDSKGGLTAETKNDLKGVMYQSIFQNGNTHLEEMFNALPVKAQKAILATAYRDYDSPNAERMNAEIQDSINAYYALSQDVAFAGAKNYKEARMAAEAWKRQLAFDDVTGESYLPSERFSNFALLLATMYKGQSQMFIQNTLGNIFDLVQGTQETTLFDEPDNTPRTLVEAINKTLSNLREELLLNGNFIYNGQRRSNVLAVGSAAGQQGRQGSDGSAPAGGRVENGERTADSAGSIENNSRQGEIAPSLFQYFTGTLSELIAQAKQSAQGLIKKVIAPISSRLKNDLNSQGLQIDDDYNHVIDNNAIRHTLKKHSGKNEEKRGQIPITYADFENIADVVEHYDGVEVVPGNTSAQRIIYHKAYQDGTVIFVEEQRVGRKELAAVTMWKKKNPNLTDANRTETTLISDLTEVSDSKGTNNSVKSSELGEKIAKAEAEVDVNPTEAQKEAGNYKKGHVQVGVFDITIEQPKGSVRSGVDANGNKWETTMQNTYGYIRGTEGVDGDHIDVFLSDDIDGWNGRRMFVVDQYNEDGSFDEHKVMLGFNDEADAQDAYLSNYEKGWEYKHKLVMSSVNLPDFEKWINSSHRKTKPFAEYKSVNKANVTNETNAPEAGFEIAPTQYTTKRGKVLDMFLVTFAEPLTKEQQRAAKELAKAEKGWYDRDKGGFMMRSEESARKLADTITGNEEVVSNAQPLSIADIRKLEEPAMRQVDVEGLMQAIRENGEAKLSEHYVPQSEQKEDISTRETQSNPKNSGQFGFVSDERMEEIKRRLKMKRGQLNMGLDPETMLLGIELTLGYIDRGIKKFADYAKVMIDEVGNEYRPYLKMFYNGVRESPEAQESGLADEMTPYDEVRTFDVANFDKGHSDALATAEMVVQEQEVNRQADEAKEKLIEQRNEQRRKEDEQTTADTEAIAGQAKAVASQAESDIKATTTEQQVNKVVERIDQQLEEVDKQLALLGYYEAEPVESDFNEAYGYMRNAEKKAVRDANRLAKRLVNDLGIDPDTIIDKKGKKRKSYAVANIAPAGGDISIYLPLSSEANLYLSIGLAPTYERNASTSLMDRGKGGRWEGDNLEVERIMYRIEQPDANGNERYGNNNFADADVTYSDLLKDIRRISKKYITVNEEVKEGNDTKQEALTKADKKPGKRQKKQDEPKIADLFSDQQEGISSESQEAVNVNTVTYNAENTEINRKFADAVKTDMLSALDSGTKPYRSILDLRKRASGLGMEVDNDGRTDILLQELVEDGLVRAAREVVKRHGSDSREAYGFICKLYEMQPTIAARSSNRIKMQQYSTPLPMAWNAVRFAMTGKKDGKVLEPTAGNGMLVFAIPAGQVHANELDGTRLANLREQGFAQVTQQDATEPFEGGKQYDAVVANPPFGKREAVDYDGKLISGLDPQITLNALASMKDDGRAAIIIGGNMEYASNGGLKSMKPFFTYLYDHYNVKGVVDMDGSLYAKQGTTYPTRMILIDGRRSEEERAQSAVYPPVQSKAIRKGDSFEALYDIIEEIINSKEKTNGTEILRSQQGQLLPVADQPSRNADRERHTEQPRKDDAGRPGGRTSVERTQEPGEVVLRGEHRTDIGDGETRRRTGGNTGGGSRGVSEPDVQRVETVGVSTERVGLEPTSTEQPKRRTLTEEKSAYRPHNSAFSLQSVAPAAMVEAMDRTLSLIEKKYGHIDEFVRKELGYDTTDELHQALAAEQVDSVAMAIYQMKQGQALIIGDQTGVGKGRQMAALIRWAVRQGEKPIFITQKADLFSDIYRDLVDIGSGDLVPFIFNSPSAKENKGEMVDANGKVVYKGLSDAKMKKVLATGKLPDECDYAVLTYSQVNTGDEVSQKEMEEAAKKNKTRSKKSKSAKDGKATPKATFLRAIAEDNYLFLDESHTAAGSSNTGAYLQSILRSAKAATFASATFAKRPDTMPLYAIRTAMSQAKVEPDKLISIIEKGGVTLQEIMSRELTNAGQMVRRERDMSDVVTDWKTINDPETVRRARENYDRTIAAFNAIIKFQEDYVKPMVDAMDKELAVMAESAGIKRGTDKMGVDNVPFASKTYNYTKQLMLALKVDAIANEVDTEIKAGRHPVIALESTMESSIKDYSAGEVIVEPTFSASLLRGLDTVMQYTIKDENGKEQHARYSPKQLGEAGEKAYYELQDFIRESTSDIFISPLDAIIERLHEMGYKIGELTGRNMYVERDDKDRVVVKRRTDKDKKRMQREFNNGELDVLILNKSASTGISLHASEKFSDQRQRTMIIAQPLSDINDYMQMIGRIDRTGQVHRGYYINLGLPVPAENRFLMMLSTKLKSLNANTTTSQDSESNEVEAPDLLNKYGSQVVVEYLRDNPDVYDKMGRPLKKNGENGGTVSIAELDEYKPQEDDARKITGNVALLTTQEQEEFYDDVVRRYNELIKYLNDTGNNDLKITVMPLRAKTLEKRVSSEGIDPTGANPFAQNSYVEQVEMDVLRKPMKAAEIRKTIEQVNKGKRPEDYIRQVISTIEKEDEARISAEEIRYERSKVRALEDIAKQTEKINRQQKRSAEEKQAAIADYVKETNENVEAKHSDNLVRLNTNSDMLKQRLHMFEVGKSYLMPDNLETMAFDFSTPAIFCGYKAKDSKITASTTLAVFATLDGRRRVEIKLSDIAALRSIYKGTNDNWDAARSTTLENWDSQIPTGTRKTGYIMTGNILQAIADTQDERGGFPGQLISYTDIDGNVHDGILMPDKWNRSMLKTSGSPIISRLKQIKDYQPVTSHDGKVEITGSSWARMYYLTVPKTKKDGAVYYENKTLLRAVHGGNFYPYRGKLRADITEKNIESVVKELSKLGVKVKEDTKEDDALYRKADDELAEVNERFNEELEELTESNADKVVLSLGRPSAILRAAGVEDKPMKLYGNKVIKKIKKHGFKLDELQNLPEAVADPIAVFKNYGKEGNRSILTELKTEQGNFLVTLTLGEGHDVDFNVVTSVFGKGESNIIDWIKRGFATYINREKALNYLHHSALKAVTSDNQELISAANIVRNFENPSVEAEINLRSGDGAFSDDDLSIANDPVSKLLGKSTRRARQRKAFAERERELMMERVRELAETLHLDNVDIVTDASTLQGNRAKAKGFFLRSTGRITIVIPNQTSVFDAEQTLLHEAVAHYGLRELFGEHFDTFLDNVYQNAEDEIKKRIDRIEKRLYQTDIEERTKRKGGGVFARAEAVTEANNKRRNGDYRKTATEEYLASLAEDTNFENVNASWWSKIKELFLRMLHKIGFENFSGVTLSDNELRYILWRSYENLAEPGRYRSILGEAADVAKQNELKVGNYAVAKERVPHVADGMAKDEDVTEVHNKSAKAERLRKLRESTPVTIMGEEYKGKYELNRDSAKQWIKDNLRGTYVNEDTGDKIELSKVGANKVTSHGERDEAHLKSIVAIPQLIEKSIFIAEQPNEKGNDKYDSYRYYVCGLNIAGEDYTAKIVIGVKGDSKYYDHRLTRIEKGTLIDNLNGMAKSVVMNQNPLISGIKDTKLLSILQADEDIMFRDGDEISYEGVRARATYESRVRSGMFQMQEALQDSMQGLKEGMRAVLAAEGDGKRIEEVEGFENAYLGENRLSSVNQAEADAFARLLFKPLTDVVSRLAHSEEERVELTDYMMAKHGLERNAYMRHREAEKAALADVGTRPKEPLSEDEEGYDEKREAVKGWEQLLEKQTFQYESEDRRDYAGLTALTETGDVWAAEEQARNMVDEYESRHDTAELWRRTKDVNEAILSKLYESGMLGRKTYEYIRSMYEFYIPLRGFDEKTSREAYAYLTDRNSAFNAPIKKAKGRRSKADDPLAYLQSMAESAIMQGNRNVLVKQRFLNFVLNHPSDLVSVSELWLKLDGVTGEWRPVLPEIDTDDSAETVAEKTEAFERRMEQLAKDFPDEYKRGKDAENIPYRVVDSRDLHEHQVVVKRGGRDVVLTVNGNPRLAQALNGQTNPDNDVSGGIGRVMQWGEAVNRQLSAFYTTRNPDFVVSNFLRDALYANSMVWVKEGRNYALLFHNNFRKVNPVQMRILFGKYMEGTLDEQNPMERMFKQFMLNGGETGYTHLRDIDARKSAIRRELRKANGQIPLRTVWDALGEQFDLMNRSVENCARFAAFMTSRQMGRSVDRAIYDAKEISVNFNKKGSGAKFLDANGQTYLGQGAALVSVFGRSGFVFWNAAIQGSTNFGRQLKRHPVKALTAMGTMFLLGAAVAALGAGGGGDDDDKNAYFNLPGYVRRSNLMFRAGDQWICIPLPVEYRAVYGMGELMVSSLSGRDRLSAGELAKEMAKQMTQVLPLDVLEGDGGLGAFMPSAVKPMYEAYVNRSWTGLPIYKDTPYNRTMPEWTKAYRSANTSLVELSKVLNEASGGDAYTSGAVDVNPAVVEHLLKGYFGGFASTLDKLVKTGETVVGSREYDPRSILLLNRVVKNGDERTESRALNEAYFRLREEHDKLRKRLRNYERDTVNGVFDYAEKIDFLHNSPEYRRYEIFESYRSDIDDLYNLLKEADANGDKEAVKDIEAQLNEVKKMMIKDMDATRK